MKKIKLCQECWTAQYVEDEAEVCVWCLEDRDPEEDAVPEYFEFIRKALCQ